MRQDQKWRGMVLSVLLLCFSGWTHAATQVTKQKAEKGPSLVIVQPTYDAGKVIEGEAIVHTFILQNKGTEDLVIKNVKPG